MNPFLISVPAAFLVTGGVAAYGAAFPRSQLFGPTISRTNSARKLAITFDDGPNPAITPKLLDLLDRYQAKATFFLIGRFVRECPDLAKETVARGHAIGNHTESHRNLFRLGPTQVTVELRLCHNAIANTLGAPAKWFRPPYGYRNPWVIPTAQALGCKTVMWTLMPGDWGAQPAEWLIRRMGPIAEHAERNATGGHQAGTRGAGDVLCLHDGWHRELNADRTCTLAALEHWLPRWRDLGLQFVTMDEAVSSSAA